MINMHTISRASSPSYEPLSRSRSPSPSPASPVRGYEDSEEEELGLLSPTARGGVEGRKVVVSNRRRWMLLLAVIGLLAMGMYWRAGFGGSEKGKVEEVALGAEEVQGEDVPVMEVEEYTTMEEAEWFATEEPTPVATATLEETTAVYEEEYAPTATGEDLLEPTATGVPASTDQGDEADEGLLAEQADNAEETKLEVTPVQLPPTIPILNVRPHPRPPPSDPEAASKMRYLSYENHSGFHNQRKSIANALVLSTLLNRTLLLPPARLGSTAAWEPHLATTIPFMERCKAGSSFLLPTDSECANSAHSDPERWTYVGWSYLVSEKLLDGRQVVDRWNGSMEWFFEDVEMGGLGLKKEEVVDFEDPDRRSYQFYDSRAMPTSLDGFTRRLEIQDLLEGEMAQARLLHFGSMFGGGRLKLSKEESLVEQRKVEERMVFEIEKVDGISDEIRDALGSYVGVHLRVGDGIFKTKARENMQGVFRKLCKDVFHLKQTQITALLEDSASRPAPRALPPRHGRRASHSLSGSAWSLTDDIADPAELDSSPTPSSLTRRAERQAKRDTPRPLSSTLRCRSPLHTTPHLLPLNMPIYIATDSRHPLTDRNLAPFFHHFPCTFLMTDFAEQNEGNSRPIDDLVEMVEGKWTSDWDGQGLANYLYPFLEAEVAAKGTDVVGSEPTSRSTFRYFPPRILADLSPLPTAPQSTFSGYTAGTLHTAYRKMGITTEQVSGSSAPVPEEALVSVSSSSDGEDSVLEEKLREMGEVERRI
ncbi:hypothetical protein BCR35DRAFT_307044 [Leucosporidium creatinivorum]|uniref:GDP-fucose protein O-fucosyltransferase-domain-containing protein n=1 Tax=Leucosporidium creatinivorum TaxID=106004 RepID=A0A1Y2EPX4_9BASI|nr:hypothetical protein BCR35DRAFT_307044 [Leucosporidium creatinivorum]